VPKKETCPHRDSVMIPCVKVDGDCALKNGVCIGCGKKPEEIHGVPQEEITLSPEQALVAKKMNIAVNKFSAKMKAAMISTIIDGTYKGWDTVPAWTLLDSFNDSVDNVREGRSISESTVDIAVNAMLINMRDK